MGGGLMQLVGYGAQDIYLTGNAQITFFKAVYRRHTNFSMESIRQSFNGSPTLGEKINCTVNSVNVAAPSSRDKSFPILPFIIFPSGDIGNCPEIKIRLFVFL